MHTVFLYVCTFIIGSFVHSGCIVADWEMFDISAILHFCVSNKKHFDVLQLFRSVFADLGGRGGPCGDTNLQIKPHSRQTAHPGAHSSAEAPPLRPGPWD